MMIKKYITGRQFGGSPHANFLGNAHQSSGSPFAYRVVCNVAPSMQPADKQLLEFGYSPELTVGVDSGYKAIAFTAKPQRIYIATEGDTTIHAIWFENEGGTIEFDIKNGKLVHMDSYGCNFSTSDGVLFVSPRDPDTDSGDRLKRGNANYTGPRNSLEFFLSAFSPPRSTAETR